MMYPRSSTLDDKYMNIKHKEIVPTPDEVCPHLMQLLQIAEYFISGCIEKRASSNCVRLTET